MEKKVFRVSIEDALDILRGKNVLMNDSEKRRFCSEVADMLEYLNERNNILIEQNYRLSERIAIMTEEKFNEEGFADEEDFGNID